MITFLEALLGLVLPALLASAGAWMALRLRRDAGAWRTRPSWDGAAMAVAAAIAYGGFMGWHALPPANVQHWLAPMALATGLALVVAGAGQGSAAWRWLTRVMLVASFLAVVLPGRAAHFSWSTAEEAGWFAAFGGAWLVMICVWDAAVARAAGPQVVAVGVVAGLGVAAQALFGSILFAKLDAGLLASLGAAAAVFCWRNEIALARAIVAVAGLLLPPLLLCGYFFADLPLWALPVFAVAGAVGWLGVPFARWPAWKRLLVVCLAAALIAGPVVVVGVISSIRASAGDPY